MAPPSLHQLGRRMLELLADDPEFKSWLAKEEIDRLVQDGKLIWTSQLETATMRFVDAEKYGRLESVVSELIETDLGNTKVAKSVRTILDKLDPVEVESEETVEAEPEGPIVTSAPLEENAPFTCVECGDASVPFEQASFSYIRFRRVLCEADFKSFDPTKKEEPNEQ